MYPHLLREGKAHLNNKKTLIIRPLKTFACVSLRYRKRCWGVTIVVVVCGKICGKICDKMCGKI